MSVSKRRFFSGRSLEQALLKAAREFGLDPSEVAYRELDKKHGFLRVRRAVVIEVDADSPAKEGAPERAAEREPDGELREATGREAPVHPEEAPAERPPAPAAAPEERSGEERREEERPREEPAAEPREEERPREEPAAEPREEERPREEPAAEPREEERPPATSSMAMAAEKAVRLALDLARIDVAVEIFEGDERLEVELSGDEEETEKLLLDEGEMLIHLQHLVPRMMRGFVGESMLVRVDCEGFHAERKERLSRLARGVARRVRDSGEEESLEPMAPDERRLVHIALTEQPGVDTRSVGRGYYKRVVIKPTRR